MLQPFVFFCTPVSVRADEKPSCNGFFYKAKRQGVPVYSEADTASEVVAKLTLGEKVCGVGEDRDFVIIARPDSGGAEKLVFSRRFDLWTPDKPGSPGDGSPLRAVRRFFNRIWSGVVPDDPLAPYRPEICSSGSECEK